MADTTSAQNSGDDTTGLLVVGALGLLGTGAYLFLHKKPSGTASTGTQTGTTGTPTGVAAWWPTASPDLRMAAAAWYVVRHEVVNDCSFYDPIVAEVKTGAHTNAAFHVLWTTSGGTTPPGYPAAAYWAAFWCQGAILDVQPGTTHWTNPPVVANTFMWILGRAPSASESTFWGNYFTQTGGGSLGAAAVVYGVSMSIPEAVNRINVVAASATPPDAKYFVNAPKNPCPPPAWLGGRAGACPS